MGLAIGLVLLASAAALLEIRGVTGNLVPILQWRWSKSQPPAYASLEPSKPRTVETNQALSPKPSEQGSYPQFLGPDRNGTLAGPKLAQDWTTRPPQEIWRHPVGAAWSGFAVRGSYAVTQEQREAIEAIVCYDLASGRLLWTHEDKERYFTTIAGEGPRATPTIDGQRVYALGATGLLNCLDLTNGKPLWATNILACSGAKLPEWGMSGSPLIAGEQVVVSAGGKNGKSLLAYAKETGQMAWCGGDDRAGYSSPRLAILAGLPQILIFNAHQVTGHDATTGAVLWDYPWSRSHPHVAMPVVLSENELLISSGYGTGAERVRVGTNASGTWVAERIWKSMGLKSKFANPVFRAGYIYGLDDGILACLDAATGERRWKDGRYGHGQLILVADLLLIMAESGEVVLVEATPEAHRERGTFQALTGKTWNPPALAGDLLLVRNDREAACFRMPLDQASLP